MEMISTEEMEPSPSTALARLPTPQTHQLKVSTGIAYFVSPRCYHMIILTPIHSSLIPFSFQSHSSTTGSALDTYGTIGGSKYSYSECNVWAVSTITQLWDKVSNGVKYGAIAVGTNIMANGGTTTLSVGEYKCSDGTCAHSDKMLYTGDIYGTIQCLNDDASCVLDGELSRRGMYVDGTGSGKLTVRAIRFYKGKSTYGGGVYVGWDAKVDIALCVFDSCEDNSIYGGGGIYVDHSSNNLVNIYATAFTGNSAASGNGDDIYRGSGTVTIHETCPSPYSANTPTQGKKDKNVHGVTPSAIIVTFMIALT